MSIGTWQFHATVPKREWTETAHRALATMRVADLLGDRIGLEVGTPPGLTLDLEAIDATTTNGETLIKTTSSVDYFFPDPGNLTFAGAHNLGTLGTYIALTQYLEPDMQDWFWPLTGEVDPHGDKLVDELSEGHHVIVALPSQPGRRVNATLIVPTCEDAGTLDLGMTKAERERIGNRNFMPATWVFETLIKGLRPKD